MTKEKDGLTKKLTVPKDYCNRCGKHYIKCNCPSLANTLGEIMGCILASGPV